MPWILFLTYLIQAIIALFLLTLVLSLCVGMFMAVVLKELYARQVERATRFLQVEDRFRDPAAK